MCHSYTSSVATSKSVATSDNGSLLNLSLSSGVIWSRGCKPGSTSHNAQPLYPKVFREPRVNTFHYIQHKSTGPSDSSTVQGTLLSGHIVFKVLKDGAQVSPPGLALDADIRRVGVFKSRSKWELSPTLSRSTIQHQQFRRNLQKWVGHEFIILYSPVHNCYDLASQVGFLPFRFKEPEHPDFLRVPANLLFKSEVPLTNAFFLMVTNPVFWASCLLRASISSLVRKPDFLGKGFSLFSFPVYQDLAAGPMAISVYV